MSEFINIITISLLAIFLPVIVFVTIIIWITRMTMRNSSSSNTKKKRSSVRAHKTPEQIAKEERQKQEVLAKWRKIEHLSEADPLYNIYGTELYTPYPVEITSDEYTLVRELESLFKRSCILVDNFFSRPGYKTTQVDCIAVDGRGIFVFESKGYSGWIFGNGNQNKWTQVLAYGKEKYRFYNPIKQNTGHISAIRNIVGKDVRIYSIIVFGAGATLKDISYVPSACRVCSIYQLDRALCDIDYEQPLEQSQIAEICRKIRATRVKVTPEMGEQHAASIREALGEDRVYA